MEANVRLRFDEGTHLWEVRRGDIGLTTERVVLDSPLKTTAHLGVLAGPLAPMDGDVKAIQVGRRRPPDEGIYKRQWMQEWVCVFNAEAATWAIWRQEAPGIVVTTANLELECHAITSGAELHCLAQMLVNGKSNRDKSFLDAKNVRLRTLIQLDQVVDVKAITVRSIARPIGS